VFIGGLVGARLVYLIGEQHITDPVELLVQLPKIWDGGIVLYGSIVGGTLAYFLAWFLIYRHQGLETLRMCDVVAPTIAVGLALGRFGCFLNGCCYGGVACAACMATPVGFPLSAPCRDVLVRTGTQTVAGFTLDEKLVEGVRVVVADRVDEDSEAYKAGFKPGSVLKAVNGQDVLRPESVEALINNVKRGSSELKLTFIPPEGGNEVTKTIYPRTVGLYPTQLYETISMVLLLLVLLAYEPLRKAPGQVMAVMMVGYGIHRWLNEILRDDPRPKEFEWVGSVVLIVGGVLMWLWLALRAGEPAGTVIAPGSEGGAKTAPTPSQG
jgi:phosphatidylglycerol---prolipoprotein diacylglyceryl transferase